MNSRNSAFGLGRALSLAAVCLTFQQTAFAQAAAADTPPTDTEVDLPGDEETPAEEAAEETPDPFGEQPTEEPAEPPEPAADEGPVPALPPTPEEQPAAEPAAGAKAEVSVDADAPKPAATDGGEDAWGIDQLSLIETPWTAYPGTQVRGITYGSLFRTFHGMQWPYMPKTKVTEKPTLQIGWSGNIWNDLSNARIDADPSLASANVNDLDRWRTQTRATLRMTPTLNIKNGWFAQGNAEIVLQGDMIADNASGGVLVNTDDLWVRVGKWDLFDITVGRFQTWEIANHYGMALDYATLEREGAWIPGASAVNKPTDGYGLDYFWDRQNYSLGGYAAHVYPTKWLRGELAGHIGSGSANAGSPKQFDIRPSAIFDIGWLKVKAGYEYGIAAPTDKTQVMRDRRNGWGVATQFVFAPYVDFGASFARGYQDIIDARDQPDLASSNTAQTVGGFVNVSPAHEPLVLGAGAFLKEWENMRPRVDGSVDTNKQWLLYGAVQYTLWKQLYLKLVVAHASNKVSDFNRGEYVNNSLSTRFRVEFLF